MAVFFTSRGDAARGLEVRERRLLYRPRKTVGLAPGFRQSIKVNETGLPAGTGNTYVDGVMYS